MAITILFIGLLVFAGHFLTGLFERTKIPDVLVLMLAGILIGPVFKVVEPSDFGAVGPVFSTLALIVILFEGGIHLGLKELGSAARATLAISLITFAVTVALIAGLVKVILPIDWLTASLIGTILGGTSSAVVVPMLRVLNLSRKPQTVLMLESAITDVLAVVLSLGLLRALIPGAAADVTPIDLTVEIGKSFLLAALIGLAGAFVWSAILPMVRQFPNTVFTTIAYVLILFGITEMLQLSGAIAALTFGVSVTNLANVPERLLGKVFSFRLVGFADVERTFFAEAVFLIKTFFFVFLGISITFGNPQTIVIGLSAAALAFIGRLVIVRVVVPRTFTRRDAMMTTLLIPKGLAAAVLASLPAQRGVPAADAALIQGTVYAVIFFSITLCAVLVFVVEGGKMDALSGSWFRRFPQTGDAADESSRPVEAFAHSLGLPALATVEEPNPIRFDAPAGGPEPTPLDHGPEDEPPKSWSADPET